MDHPAFAPGNVAVVTGAALGIGRAACRRFARLGMRVCLVDLARPDLNEAFDEVVGCAPNGAAAVMSRVADVSDAAALSSVRRAVEGEWESPAVLMNNAATRVGRRPDAPLADWRRSMEVNFWGVVQGVETFLDGMLARAAPGLIVNSGSKQGITNPPGNTIYNVTKSALKTYTEALQHDLRNRADAQLSAHLLVPGFTTTGHREHSDGAWLPDQVIEHMLERLDAGAFYILCPDNEVTPEMDAKRIRWAAEDIVQDRPALSRWHPDWRERFAQADD